jgi:hypothetical protein
MITAPREQRLYGLELPDNMHVGWAEKRNMGHPAMF